MNNQILLQLASKRTILFLCLAATTSLLIIIFLTWGIKGVLYLFSILFLLLGISFLFIGGTRKIKKEDNSQKNASSEESPKKSSTIPATSAPKTKTLKWWWLAAVVLAIVVIAHLWQLRTTPLKEEFGNTTGGPDSAIKLTFNKWDSVNLGFQRITIPDNLRGKPLWLIASGDHYMPYDDKNGKVMHLRVKPGTGAYPWRNYPLERKLPIPDKSKLGKLIVKTEKGGIQFAGTGNDSPITTNRDYLLVSVNYIQSDPTAWTLAAGNVKIEIVSM